MLYTYSHLERKFIRNENDEIIGIEPVSVKEHMVYRDGKLDVPFNYDTAIHSESDVKNMLDGYPSFVSRLFNSIISYFSRRIWGLKNV